ncbi:MAG TPA: IS481 family transposase, partial [Candidatus Nanoarchaeia archaeon]|nr:IS481 family transposase [Candidatus Nanoarchaeia archaeon]
IFVNIAAIEFTLYSMNSYNSQYMQLKEQKLKNIINKEKTVILVAEELRVSRQTIHKWLARYKRFGIDGLITRKRTGSKTAPNRTSEAIEQLVINIANKYWNDGVVTLHDHLLFENNIDINPSTIYRILKRNNVRYTTIYPATRQKWKKQLYAHQLPGLELQMDTKYPYGYKQGKVIYTIIDDASRWVFAWSYDTANTNNTLDFLTKVLYRAPFLIHQIRTDQGKEFIAIKVREYLKSNNIKHRLNTPYCPEENGKIERFHRTLNEKGLRFGFKPSDSLELMQYRLNLFLHYYNYRKKHRGLGMAGVTPFERLQTLGSVNLTVRCYKIVF